MASPTFDPKSGTRGVRALSKRNETVRSLYGQLQTLGRRPATSVSVSKALEISRELVRLQAYPTIQPLLPLMINLKGKPYTLERHFHLEPLFKFLMPKRLALKTGRQTGKTAGISCRAIVCAGMIPQFTNLIICPLFEQVRRLSANYVKPMISESPIAASWTDNQTEKSVLQKTFTSKGKLIFSFALLNADRVRGVPADALSIDEVQGIDPDLIPIMAECLSGSTRPGYDTGWRIQQYTGTPLSYDNTMEKVFSDGSMAEWEILCDHCGRWNMACIHNDLEQMIGPAGDHVGPDRPGTICANSKCRRTIDPRLGHWKHGNPELMHEAPSYHVPQILLPQHYGVADAWAEIHRKMHGGAMSPAQFQNEVLGESCDVGSRLVTKTDLIRAASLDIINDPHRPENILPRIARGYAGLAMGIDWGGGGEVERLSYTAVCLVGLRPGGTLDLLWGRRLLTPNDHMREAQQIVEFIKLFRPNILAHDFGGGGPLRETILLNLRAIDPRRILPITLVRQYDPYVWKEPNEHRLRGYLQVDKTRMLLFVVQALRSAILRTFRYDSQVVTKKDARDIQKMGLLDDFMALVQEKLPTRTSGDIYAIFRAVNKSDDFAMAVMMATVALWTKFKAWPDFIKSASAADLDPRQRRAVGDGITPEDWQVDEG